MLLHTPIGLLVGLAAVELVIILGGVRGWLGVVRLLAFLTAASALMAALSGFLLSREGSGLNYDAVLIDRHLKLGLAFTLATAVIAALALWGDRPKARRAALLLALLLMIPAGHLGASMTHGSDFLLAPLRAKREPAPTTDSPTAPTFTPTTRFAAEIEPIFARTCYACHGEEKSKGGLRTHTREHLLAGGDFGSLFVPGDPAASQLIERVRLPLNDDDHMPPEGKPQPTQAEIAAIEDWIRRGARFDEPAAAQAPALEPKKTPALPLPPANALAALRAALVHAEPVAADTHALIVSFAAVAPTIDDDSAVRLLAPLAAHLDEVNLARTRVGPKTLAALAAAPRLRRLDLSATPVTIADLTHLKGHTALESLTLARTPLAGTDADLRGLVATLPALLTLYAWDANLAADTPTALAEVRPGLLVNIGDRATTDLLETEPPITLAGTAPPPAANASAAANLTPINTVCPVSSSPVKPEYQIVYQGRVIGFCCPNCPKAFWDDPAKFLAAIDAAK
jgi:YHS domain-containing protein